MITATFNRKYNRLTMYSLTGHAKYADLGTDIVCAGVSALYFTITSELSLLASVSQDGDTYTVDVHTPNLVTDTLILALKNGLTEISNSYPDNVEVKIVDC